MFNIIDHGIAARIPHRLTTVSDYHPSIPVLLLATSLVRPTMIVELGVYRGDSLCAFAQATKELNLTSRIFGIDTWRGDSHCGQYGEPILMDLETYLSEMRYGHVQLIRSTTQEAADKFRDGTIDLLHIDASHIYEDVKADFESYLPKMSPRGVVLFHDIYVTDRTYGVWKCWTELKERYPDSWYEFPHAWGVGFLSVGEFPSSGVLDLLTLRGSPEALSLQHFLEVLGNNVMDVRALSSQAPFTTEDPWTGISGNGAEGRPRSSDGSARTLTVPFSGARPSGPTPSLASPGTSLPEDIPST